MVSWWSFGKKKAEKRHSDRWIFGTMLVFAIVGLIASFVLSVEKIHLLQNPDAVLSCSINLVLDCSTVMQTWQATVFGFPNSYIGMMAYPVVITVAMIGLVGAASVLPRWFWRTAIICYALGAIFAYWLFFSSMYVIEVLCPWCLFVTFSTTILLATIKHYAVRENIWQFSKPTHKKLMTLLEKDIDKVVVAGWLVILVALVFIKFGDSLFL